MYTEKHFIIDGTNYWVRPESYGITVLWVQKPTMYTGQMFFDWSTINGMGEDEIVALCVAKREMMS